MVRCSRHSNDPLLRHFLRRRVNLLDPPRAVLPLGTTFVVRGDDIYDMPLADLVDNTVAVEQLPGTGTIPERTEVLSDGLSVDAGASLSGAFLRAVGLLDAEPDIVTALRAMGAQRVFISVKDLSVLRLKRERLQTSLAKCLIRKEQTHADGRHAYYVATGTWAATEMDFRIEGRDGRYLGASAELNDLLSTGGKVDVQRGYLSQTLLRSPKPLVFGVELMGLGRRGDGLILVDRRPDGPARGDEVAAPLAFLGDDEAFFTSGPLVSEGAAGRRE